MPLTPGNIWSQLQLQVLICTFLVTSEYCLETTQQLEGKLREKAASGAAGAKINLGPEQDVYHSVINSCIQLLVQGHYSVLL